MKQIESSADLIKLRVDLTGSVGFVPTMGALHQGHLELIKESLKNNDHTIVSIFVNPTQFNDKKDFEFYPQDLSGDLTHLQNLGVTIAFTPKRDDLYPDNYNYKVSETNFSKILCGKSRPGHFDGVLTIVLKLINITRATNVYFGEKDFQQYKLIKEMVSAFFINTNIIALPTVRESSGLAMSSRNQRLSQAAREHSSLIYKNLTSSKNLDDIRISLENEGFAIDYLEDIEGRRFIAAQIENIRLIDNVKI